MRAAMSQRTPPYHDTVLEFRTEPAFEIDLRQPVDAASLARLRATGLGHPFAVITACNPGGQRRGAAENASRTAALEAALHERGAAFTPVDGCSPDRSHREPGFAMRLPLPDARALARRFGQDALFWFRSEERRVGTRVD